MLVDTNIAAGNQQKHLELTFGYFKALLLSAELSHIDIDASI